jgi:TetR/AcrR family transcriptional regulator
MQDTRERIISSAVEEFSTHGFHGARVRRIAQLARVNKQLLYYYFGSKRQLYEHSLRAVAARLRPEPGWERATAGTPGERLRSLLRLAATQCIAHPNLVRATMLGALEGSPVVGTDLPPAAQELVGRVAAEVSRGQGLGYFRDDIDPEDCGRQAAVLLLGWVALGDALLANAEPQAAEPAWIDSVISLISRLLTW